MTKPQVVVRRPLSIAVLLVVIVLAACSPGDSEPVASVVGPVAVQSENADVTFRRPEVIHQGIHAVYDTLAAIAHSFVGLSYSSRDDRFVVGLTELSDSTKIAGEVVRQLEQRVQYYSNAKLRLPKPRLRFEKKLTSWRALSSVRDSLLLDPSFDFPARVSVDEGAGIIRIGLGSLANVTSFQRALTTRPNLSRFVSVEVADAVSPVQPTDLNGRFRPLAGGTRGLNGCSVTIAGFVNSQARVLTASHCTLYKFGLDGGPFQQPFGAVPFWGGEVEDLPTYRCGSWINRKDCRRADIAVFSINGIDLNSPEQPFFPGLIARPIARVAGAFGVPGPTSVSGFLEVAGVLSWAVKNEVVEKIGAETGWTFGVVTDTCVDETFPGGVYRSVVVVCTDVAQIAPNGGDSGGPVLKDLNTQSGGNQVLFMGVMVAENAVNNSIGVYSSFNQIRQEIPTPCFVYGC
jgi:hypothetical protein